MNFLNMKRFNTRGIALATKHVLMDTLAYNLKKYLKFINRKYAANSIALPVNERTEINNNIGIYAFYFPYANFL